MSRIVVLLHPNTSFAEFILNDRMFNKEQYTHSRQQEAQGPEQTMLRVLNTCTHGIEAAQAARNTLKIEIQDGFLLNEIVPEVLIAIKEFIGEKDYTPQIFVDDRRYIVNPVYAPSTDEWDFDREIEAGVKAKPGEVDIGVPYTVWKL